MADGESAQPPVREDDDERERLTVLVVDDNRDAADSLAEVLLAYGHRATTAYGGKEAIEKGTREGYDVALVDIGMPEVDGLEVARQIHRLEGIAHDARGTHGLGAPTRTAIARSRRALPSTSRSRWTSTRWARCSRPPRANATRPEGRARRGSNLFLGRGPFTRGPEKTGRDRDGQVPILAV
mgnify:CR=1 FL=1